MIFIDLNKYTIYYTMSHEERRTSLVAIILASVSAIFLIIISPRPTGAFIVISHSSPMALTYLFFRYGSISLYRY